MGRRGSGHAGLQETRLFHDHFQTANRRPSRRQNQLSVGPETDAGAKRETKALSGQSEMNGQVLRILGLSAYYHLLRRRHHRGHDHHVFRRGKSYREIGTMRALGFRRRNILWPSSPSRCSWGSSAAPSVYSGLLMQFITFFHRKLSDFSELPLNSPSPVPSLSGHGFLAHHGLIGGVLPAFRASANEYCRGLRAA